MSGRPTTQREYMVVMDPSEDEEGQKQTSKPEVHSPIPNPFRMRPLGLRIHLINGASPAPEANEWVGAAEAKRLRVEVMRVEPSYIARVCQLPVHVIEGWEDGSLAPSPEGVQIPPDWWQRHVFGIYALAQWLERQQSDEASK